MAENLSSVKYTGTVTQHIHYTTYLPYCTAPDIVFRTQNNNRI